MALQPLGTDRASRPSPAAYSCKELGLDLSLIVVLVVLFVVVVVGARWLGMRRRR
jgi:hypothetical protein